MTVDFKQRILQNEFRFYQTASHFPVLSEMKNIPQNPEYHGEGDVWNHTKQVCWQMIHLPEWQGLTREEKVILYASALFHDIGKISCTKTIDGIIQSPKHAIKGSKVFRELAYENRLADTTIPFFVREQIASLIRFHGLPIFFLEKENIEFELIRASFCVSMKQLYLLAKADALGRKCRDQDFLLKKIEYFKEYVQELGCFETEQKFANPFTKFQYFYGTAGYQSHLYDTSQFDVTVLAGFPLSGKDTYIQNNLPELPVVSLDQIREEFGLSPARGSGKAVFIGKERAKELLRKKQPFIWNATNLIRENRNNLCQLFSAYGARVNWIYLEAPYCELLKRNQIRKRNLPVLVLNRMIHQFDMLEKWEGYQISYFIEE